MTSDAHAGDQDEIAEQVALAEIRRHARLVDQAMSMQATLRDWDRVLGTTLTGVVLIASLIGVAFAFAGDGSQRISLISLNAERVTWLGWLAVITFALTLLTLILDPQGAARRRGQAVRSLGALKREYRIHIAQGHARETAERLARRYDAVMASVPEVPNYMFNRLKAGHLRKIQISAILSDHPGMRNRHARRLLRKQLR
jgi:hypothetical protein